jgi:ABC-type polar amino acid transport system ATPase subunit
MTGRSATGKSTFINTIRNLKPGDDGFAMAGSGDTTITPKCMINILRKKDENISTAENSPPTVSSHGDVEDLLINVP